ncbi:MFS transporter [Natronosporangium hydrolyticum]|uniref:MFS transporter n=1 Tax=Natronosporangium hydrolyticum TaxID=2811111 RepID=A0A895YJ05_9ACTN|nr:MFS transporter [Natronosporangium hydrolyticum]QSB15975.1 MFS transporter [Natronosporangium hydrolyticum]
MSDDRPSERKVTFGEVFAIGEYRALFASTQLAWLGEYMAKAAVMALVFAQTGSVAMSAAAFAISFAPWLLGGPFLATLAERYRYRSVMVVCDVIRAGLIALVALPGMPLPAMLLLVFLVALAAPPGQAARSATLPLVLTGERVVLGLAINQSSGQATQVLGYFAGAVIAIIDPRGALLINAAAFILSAIILRFGVKDRPPQMRAEHRSHLLRETGEGFKLVFGTPALRVIALLVFTAMLFSMIPEGLAIGWASELAEGEETRQGFYQGLIMVANPIGFALGVLLVARLLLPTTRRRLVPLLAVLGPLALVPALFNPQIAVVLLMAMVSGLAMAGMLPTLNGMFVQALPNGFRARAFGVMNSGMQAIQGFSVLAAGALVGVFGNQRLPMVVGFWCLVGVLIMVFFAARWPKPAFFEAAIARTEAINQAAAAEQAATADQATAAEPRPAADHAAEPPADGATADPEPASPAAGVPRQPAGPEQVGPSANEAGTMER